MVSKLFFLYYVENIYVYNNATLSNNVPKTNNRGLKYLIYPLYREFLKDVPFFKSYRRNVSSCQDKKYVKSEN